MAYNEIVGQEEIAYEYRELPLSELKSGVGCMPGKELEELEEDELVSGRGLIP